MKRRVDSDIDVSSTDESDAELEEVIDVDFDYFDLNPAVDFHAVKNLLRQLFGDDSSLVNLSGLAELAMQNVGTTIKTDGKDGDPFALLSVVNVTQNAENASVKGLAAYLVERTRPDAELQALLKQLLLQQKLQVGLVLSERMINMPVEVVPPMYRMLKEEMALAAELHEKYEFDYFLVVSKVYEVVEGEGEKDRGKRRKAAEGAEFDYFHYEDMVLEKHARRHGHFEYTTRKQETDSRRVFTEYGIDPRLSVLLLAKEGMERAIEEMPAQFPPF